MHPQDFRIGASDGTALRVLHWQTEAAPKALLMIAHGMAEHAERYARLAEILTAAGYGVYALDQRGHGRTADQGMLGHYADTDGWNKVYSGFTTIDEVLRVTEDQGD